MALSVLKQQQPLRLAPLVTILNMELNVLHVQLATSVLKDPTKLLNARPALTHQRLVLPNVLLAPAALTVLKYHHNQ